MGDLSVMDVHEWDMEKVRELPVFEEVVAVVAATRIVPVGRQQEQSIELVFEGVAGPRKGHCFTRYITVWSRDMEARRDGRNTLHALFRALGMELASDSSTLRNKLVVLHLVRERGEEDRPHVQFVHCARAAHAETRRWLDSEGEAFRERLARERQDTQGGQ